MTNSKIKKRLYIFTNGEKTEIEYFKYYRDFVSKNSGDYQLLIKTPVKGGIDNLVNIAIKRKLEILKRKGYSKKDGDEIWLVFDIDNEHKENPKKIEEVLKKAKDSELNLAWSNKCFELWFLLHFTAVDFEIQDYHQALEKPCKNVDHNYKKNKNLDKLFEILINKTDEAIKNAKKLNSNAFTNNPSTRVFEIMSKLNLK